MLKETETEETISFIIAFLLLVAFQLGRPGPPGYAYDHISLKYNVKIKIKTEFFGSILCRFSRKFEAKTSINQS